MVGFYFSHTRVNDRNKPYTVHMLRYLETYFFQTPLGTENHWVHVSYKYLRQLSGLIWHVE